MTQVVNYDIKYDFFKEYIAHDKKENKNNFELKLKVRFSKIKNLYLVSSWSEEQILQEYFVEIFCWSVFPLNILHDISNILKKNGIDGIIDPCCGNGFHSYLFREYLNFRVFSVDIQEEKEGWVQIIEEEGRLFLKKLPIQTHLNNALFLSWIDYDLLSQDLLNLYHGNLVVSVGNYDKHKSIKYLKDLRSKFTLLKTYNLIMPWKLEEKIEIYIRNNKFQVEKGAS